MMLAAVWLGILVLISSSTVSASVVWKRYGLDQCSNWHCDDIYMPNRSFLCSPNSGVYYAHGAEVVQDKCITATMTNNRLFSPKEILDAVGFGGVLAFVGDSIVRHLFVVTMQFLGPEYIAWFRDLEKQAAHWDGAPREKIDHTYLCSPPLGPYNITIAFFWRIQLGSGLMNKLPFNRGWLNCVWWENGNSMRHCDASLESGSQERWQGGDILDAPQIKGKPKREFIVIASGAVHSTHSCRGFTNEEDYMSKSEPFKAFMDPWVATKPLWTLSDGTQQLGRGIFLIPLLLKESPGIDSTHHCLRATNRVIRHFLSDPLRHHSQISCSGGYEIIDTINVTGVEGSRLEPGTVGDGIHYEDIVNYVLLQLIAERLILFNSNNWRQSSSWDLRTSYPSNSCERDPNWRPQLTMNHLQHHSIAPVIDGSGTSRALYGWQLPALPPAGIENTLTMVKANGAPIGKFIPQNIFIAVRNASEALPNHLPEFFKKNSDWRVIIHGNYEKDLFMETYFANTSLLWAYQQLNPQIGCAKPEIWRLAVLYLFGGLYMDDDANLDTKLDDIVQNTDKFIIAQENSQISDRCYIDSFELSLPSMARRFGESTNHSNILGGKNYLNWAIFSTARHPLLERTIVRVIQLIMGEYFSRSLIKPVHNDRGILLMCASTYPLAYASHELVLEAKFSPADLGIRVCSVMFAEYGGNMKAWYNDYRPDHWVKVMRRKASYLIAWGELPIEFRNGELLQAHGSTSLHVVYNGTRHQFSSMDGFETLRCQLHRVRVVPLTQLEAITAGAVIPALPSSDGEWGKVCAEHDYTKYL